MVRRVHPITVTRRAQSADMRIPLLLVILPLFLRVVLCESDTPLREKTCATTELIAALGSRQCAELEAAEVDVVTMRVAFCMCRHVGLTDVPQCLQMSSDARECLSTVPSAIFEFYVQLRRRWGALCAAAAAYKLMAELSEAVEGVRGCGGGEIDVGVGMREARKAAMEVFEANVEALEGLKGLNKIVGGMKGGVVERLREREREVREGFQEVAREREKVKEVVGRVGEVMKDLTGQMGQETKETLVKGVWWGDGLLVGCALVAKGWRWERLVVAGLVGLVQSLEIGKGKLGAWVWWAIAAGRVAAVVACMLATGVRTEVGATKDGEQSVEDANDDGAWRTRCWEDQSAALSDEDD